MAYALPFPEEIMNFKHGLDIGCAPNYIRMINVMELSRHTKLKMERHLRLIEVIHLLARDCSAKDSEKLYNLSHLG